MNIFPREGGEEGVEDEEGEGKKRKTGQLMMGKAMTTWRKDRMMRKEGVR